MFVAQNKRRGWSKLEMWIQKLKFKTAEKWTKPNGKSIIASADWIFNTLDNQFRGKVQWFGNICCLARVISSMLPSNRINIQHGITIAQFDRCYSRVIFDWSTIEIPFKIDGKLPRSDKTLYTGRITKIRWLVSEIKMRNWWRNCVGLGDEK